MLLDGRKIVGIASAFNVISGDEHKIRPLASSARQDRMCVTPALHKSKQNIVIIN